MEDQDMDARTKTVIASLLALIGLLAIAAYGSLHQARPNAALHDALFGAQE